MNTIVKHGIAGITTVFMNNAFSGATYYQYSHCPGGVNYECCETTDSSKNEKYT